MSPHPSPLPRHILRPGGLGRSKPVAISLSPDPDETAAIRDELGLGGLRKLRLSGELIPEGKEDWRLEAHLGASVTQPCVVTLAPVTTRIDTDITRRYLRDWQMPQDDEAEIPEDDTEEALPGELDLYGVLIEALALALPLYPRADGVDLGEAVFAPPGVAPLRDRDVKPFAGLESLKEKLAGGTDDDTPEDPSQDR